MTRAEIREALLALTSAATWADRAAEVLKLQAEREGREGESSLVSVHLTRIRTARESAARLRALLEEPPAPEVKP